MSGYGFPPNLTMYDLVIPANPDEGPVKSLEIYKPRKSSPASPEDWESHKKDIRDLYLTKSLPLNHITVIMARTHSFYAT